MRTLGPHMMRHILDNLDIALQNTRRDTPAGILVSDATRHIQWARESLLDAALGAVDVAAPAESNVAEPMRVAA
jgi:hypothetical protein